METKLQVATKRLAPWQQRGQTPKQLSPKLSDTQVKAARLFKFQPGLHDLQMLMYSSIIQISVHDLHDFHGESLRILG